MKLAWSYNTVGFRVDPGGAQCLFLTLAPGLVNALEFTTGFIILAYGVSRLCADNHIYAAGHPHEGLKYDSCTITVRILQPLTRRQRFESHIQAHGVILLQLVLASCHH